MKRLTFGASASPAGSRRRFRAGFTLLEMVLVIGTILFLLGVLMVLAGNVQTQSQEMATRQLISGLESALDDYFAATGQYPEPGADYQQRRHNLYDALAGEKSGGYMPSVSDSFVQREPPGGNFPGKPYLVDAWKNPLQYLPFDKVALAPQGLWPASQKTVLENERQKWGMNGGRPLIWSWGPDGRGWVAEDLQGTGAGQLENYMYLGADAGINSDNLTNYRDIPLQYVQ